MRVYKFRVNDDTKYFIEGLVEIESLGKLVLRISSGSIDTRD